MVKADGLGGEMVEAAQDLRWVADLILGSTRMGGGPDLGSGKVRLWLMGGLLFLIKVVLKGWYMQAAVEARRFGSTMVIPAIWYRDRAVII
jgi:hypothetical protein